MSVCRAFRGILAAVRLSGASWLVTFSLGDHRGLGLEEALVSDTDPWGSEEVGSGPVTS